MQVGSLQADVVVGLKTADAPAEEGVVLAGGGVGLDPQRHRLWGAAGEGDQVGLQKPLARAVAIARRVDGGTRQTGQSAALRLPGPATDARPCVAVERPEPGQFRRRCRKRFPGGAAKVR